MGCTSGSWLSVWALLILQSALPRSASQQWEGESCQPGQWFSLAWPRTPGGSCEGTLARKIPYSLWLQWWESQGLFPLGYCAAEQADLGSGAGVDLINGDTCVCASARGKIGILFQIAQAWAPLTAYRLAAYSPAILLWTARTVLSSETGSSWQKTLISTPCASTRVQF